MRNAVAAALVMTFGAAAELGADPILVQPGSAYSVTNLLAADGTPDTTGTFFFSPDFLFPFGLPIFGRELSNNARSGCQPCFPGDPLNLSASFELRGPSYQGGGPGLSVWGVGTLNFTTPTVTVPFEIPPPQFPFYAFAPFQLVGHIELFGEPGTVPVFSGDVIGFGRARALLTGSGESRTFSTLEYQFTRDPMAPVPEPATVTLIVTGLAAMGARARRRRIRESQAASSSGSARESASHTPAA
jgi:hypothetical protein